MDSRSVGARSVLRHADPDGRESALAAMDDARGGRRSDAAEDDDVHARHVYVHVSVGAVGPGALLAREQCLADRPAIRYQFHNRTARDADDAAGGGTPSEAGRRREDRSRGCAEELTMSDPTQPIVDFLD